MALDYFSFARALDEKRNVTENDVEYWMARDLMPILAYASWDKFESVIQRAIEASKSARITVDHHFSRTGNMVQIGSGAQRSAGDWYLTRYACYLIAMNADPSKSEVGHAMTYFAVQTRRQEVLDQLTDAEKRLNLRLRLMDHNRQLFGAAKHAGVTRYPIFQDAGYRGLYGGMGLSEVKAHKRLAPKEDLLDNVGHLELSAHDFRAALTEHRLNHDHVNTERTAIETHRKVGEEVRGVMVRDNGIKPENLPTEPSIKRLVTKARKRITGAS